MTIIRLYNKYVKASAALQPYVPQADKIATKRVENTNANNYETLIAGIQAFEESPKKNFWDGFDKHFICTTQSGL